MKCVVHKELVFPYFRGIVHSAAESLVVQLLRYAMIHQV